ncbi:hypothetical protein [Promineifilum sp.]|uniref:helix-turn-helix domain-containing protein n=1 Tax=Promineifilum sp. TaxID=2664178 RepID=UPI0035AFA4DE
MLNAELYDLIQSLWGAFAGAMTTAAAAESAAPPPAILQLQAGQAESPAWFLIQAAEFDPEPLTVERLRVRDIYASERIVAALLEVMAAEKWFDRRGDEYFLRFEGRAALDRIRANRARRLAALRLPAEPLTRLERRLRDLLDRSLLSGDPPGTWSLTHSRRRAPADDASAAECLFQYVADFNAFRDDCHMASWRGLGVEGYVWEAFSLVAGGAPTADALFEALPYRGYSATDYAAALEELRARGWISQSESGWQLTDDGRAVRATVEAQTDAYFYAPWAHLSPAGVLAVRDDIGALGRQLETAV